MTKRVNIRPGVSVLSVLRHLRYSYWHALAEFVDNALQSWVANRDRMQSKLRVDISLLPQDGGVIIVRDNAAGIAPADFPRAFKPASVPTDRTGLSEFGMGMKSAACWCARQWSVRTKPLDDPNEYVIRFDIEQIVTGEIEELDIVSTPAQASAHYTEIRLEGLHKAPVGRTLGKIREHLGDIYREFFRRGQLVLELDGRPVTYEEPPVLLAPYFKTPNEPAKQWKREIDFDFGSGLRVHGFAAIRERASTTRAGFALFRRGRVIEGSGDEGYRPAFIFGNSNSFIYQRLFGELHLEGFEVTHTKDGFKWDDNEEVFLEILRDELTAEDMPLLQQAKGYRVGERPEDLQKAADTATSQVADALERTASPVIAQLRADQTPAPIPAVLPPVPVLASRQITLSFAPWTWIVTVEHSTNPADDWLTFAEQASPPDTNRVRRLGLRLSLAHPFMQRFAGADADQIEPLLRVAVAIGLAETIARESSSPLGRVRQNVNELLRLALSAP